MRKFALFALVTAAFVAFATGCNTPNVAKGDSGYAARLVPIHPEPVPVTAAPRTERPVDR
ncbi:MAG: hypothetical protein ACTHN5_04130 [Phycisphaerae bacterium]